MTAAPTLESIEATARGAAEVWWDLPSLCALLPIVTKGDGKVLFHHDTWHAEQKKFQAERTGRDFVLKPRAIGFSTLELARDFQYARTHEGANVVVMVHTGKAKTQFFNAVRIFERALREEWGLLPTPESNTTTGLRWNDIDSSITVIEAGKDELSAADRGRSGTIHRLHASEVAFYRAPRETMKALDAAVGENETVIESTANGTGNWFHEHAELARDGLFGDYAFHFFPWFEHSLYRADPAIYTRGPKTKREEFWETELRERHGCDRWQIAFWRQQVSKNKIDGALQEYPPTPDAAFEESDETAIDKDALDRLKTRIVQRPETRRINAGARKYPPLRVHRGPQAGVAYLVIVDPSGGTGRDEAAIKVMELRGGDDCASWHDNRTKPGELAYVAVDVAKFFNNAIIVVERNETENEALGKETLHVLETVIRYPRLWRDPKGALGWNTNSKNRPVAIHDLIRLVEDDNDPISSPDARTVSELSTLIVNDEGKVEARDKGKPGGADDGLVMCLAIGHQVRQMMPRPGRSGAAATGTIESAGFQT